ncbi:MULTISPECIES: hypothetical protein [Paenibacillus]|uniref:hypothetical protein n=1 Tax=Paenibacillus TaxID=44249 RepID=UPI000376F15B|nr:hypothetical protein [Paenibacillus massiliensis]
MHEHDHEHNHSVLDHPQAVILKLVDETIVFGWLRPLPGTDQWILYDDHNMYQLSNQDIKSVTKVIV